MKKLLLLTLLTFNAYAVDPLIEPTTPFNCLWPTERENNDPFPEEDRGGINLYHSDVSGVYDKGNPIATSTSLCGFVIDNTLLANGDHYYVYTAFDTNGLESVFSVESTHVIEWPNPPKPPMPLRSPAP